jgi:hypothetical protein
MKLILMKKILIYLNIKILKLMKRIKISLFNKFIMIIYHSFYKFKNQIFK